MKRQAADAGYLVRANRGPAWYQMIIIHGLVKNETVGASLQFVFYVIEESCLMFCAGDSSGLVVFDTLAPASLECAPYE